MMDGTPRTCRGGFLNPTYGADGICSSCGSLNPETFMDLLEKREIEVIPTDKSYKVYVRYLNGKKFNIAHGVQLPDKTWGTEFSETDQWKFYFEHLSEEQKQKFVDLYNERKMDVGYPGHFYRLPYFMTVVPKESIQ